MLLLYMLQHWNQLDDVTVEDLMKFIKGTGLSNWRCDHPGSGR